MAYTTDEDDATIIRNNFAKVATAFQNIVDPDTQESRKRRISAAQEAERLDSERYAREAKEVREREERIRADKFSAFTQNRHLRIKKIGQILYTEPQPCPFCNENIRLIEWRDERETKIRGPLYNPNIGSFDPTISYENKENPDTLNFEVPHHCNLENDNSAEILNKKIEGLRTELKEYKEFVKRIYRPWPSM